MKTWCRKYPALKLIDEIREDLGKEEPSCKEFVRCNCC